MFQPPRNLTATPYKMDGCEGESKRTTIPLRLILRFEKEGKGEGRSIWSSTGVSIGTASSEWIKAPLGLTFSSDTCRDQLVPDSRLAIMREGR